MEFSTTPNILPDLLASSALLTLAIYHFMIYWGRRKDVDEKYNLYFSFFVLSAALLLIALYFQPQYFLYKYKPPFINVINIEMLAVWCLFISGIKFLNLLLKVPPRFNKYFYILLTTITLNLFSTLFSIFKGPRFYYEYILTPLLLIVAINIIILYGIYGYWIYKEKLHKDHFVLTIFFGFVLLTLNIFIYRTIELNHIPRLLIPNHYFTAIMLYVFAWALTIKFNKEYAELKELKINLESKVELRTDELSQANQKLEKKNLEIELQKQEISKINEELLQRAEELKELDAIKSRFFTNISHEFRTPLTLIIGPLEALFQNSESAADKQEYTQMLTQARRLLALINQLLELSRLQKNMLKLKLELDNLITFNRTIVTAYTSFAKELKIDLEFTADIPNQLFWFDKDVLEKIITNLITNALKYTPKGGMVNVMIRFASNNEYIEIIVRDNGIGIEKDQLSQIFNPFYQVENPVQKKVAGSGIGLALVKELVQLHKGTISVFSEVEKGTEFIINLPSDKSVYSEEDFSKTTSVPESFIFHADYIQNEEDPEQQILSEEKTIILLVDDNSDMRHFIRKNLEPEYQVIEAIDGAKGFGKATEIIPDIIIADVMMPEKDGFGMTKLLKSDELTSHIPVILLTAKASLQSRLEGLETLADDYITKPFHMNELLLRIRNLVEIRKKLQEKYSKNIVLNPSQVSALSMDEKFLQKALQIVETNMGEPDFNVTQFCVELNMSRTQVHRKLTALTGQSSTEFIRILRLKRAAQLLNQKAGSVSEIAYETGFMSLSHFSKSFKEFFGILPSEYK